MKTKEQENDNDKNCRNRPTESGASRSESRRKRGKLAIDSARGEDDSTGIYDGSGAIVIE